MYNKNVLGLKPVILLVMMVVIMSMDMLSGIGCSDRLALILSCECLQACCD